MSTHEQIRTGPQNWLRKVRKQEDLCEQGGILNGQWKRMRDLVSKDALRTFGGILLGMGLSGTALQVVAVALVVYVLHLGDEAFCAGGE
jgi:hypothetical protein